MEQAEKGDVTVFMLNKTGNERLDMQAVNKVYPVDCIKFMQDWGGGAAAARSMS